MEEKQKIKWWWNIPIILLVVILISLGIRSIVTAVNRYGWGTFSKQVAFRVNYYWINKDGEEKRYKPGKELSGKTRKKLKKAGSTRYSDGALKSWINNYVRFMYMNNKPSDDIRSFRAEVFYKVNTRSVKGRDRDKADVIMIEYPENIKD
jgi:hypothetical protein